MAFDNDTPGHRAESESGAVVPGQAHLELTSRVLRYLNTRVENYRLLLNVVREYLPADLYKQLFAVWIDEDRDRIESLMQEYDRLGRGSTCSSDSASKWPDQEDCAVSSLPSASMKEVSTAESYDVPLKAARAATGRKLL